MQKSLSLSQSVMLGLVGLAVFMGLWTGLSASGMVPRVFLPSPLEVWNVSAR